MFTGVPESWLPLAGAAAAILTAAILVRSDALRVSAHVRWWAWGWVAVAARLSTGSLPSSLLAAPALRGLAVCAEAACLSLGTTRVLQRVGRVGSASLWTLAASALLVVGAWCVGSPGSGTAQVHSLPWTGGILVLGVSEVLCGGAIAVRRPKPLSGLWLVSVSLLVSGLANLAWSTPGCLGVARAPDPAALAFLELFGHGLLAVGMLTAVIDEERGQILLADARMRHAAAHDALTGLPNRPAFVERVAAAVNEGRTSGQRVAVLFVDLDRFRAINGALGSHAGDEVLRGVAHRLTASVRDGDAVARLGGDEFGVLARGVRSAEDAIAVARKVVEVIRRPGQVQGREIVVTASVGVTVFPDDADDAETLLRNAIGAAYRAKDEGRDNLSAHAAVTAARAAEHLSLEQGLRSALSQRELVLLYQPVVDLRTGGVDAVEALIRWQHPQLGLLGADVVIGVAEASGLIHTIGEWALRTACLEVAAARRAGHPTLGLCVNLSAHQFDQPGVVERIGSALAEAQLPPEFLELEITETVAMRDVEATASCLRRLKDMGTRIAIDDFGTGYSGLSYLKQFSLDTLKIDKSFIRDVAVDRDDGALVTAIISMAHARRLRTVAEGIENQEQLRFLLSRGCDRAQGFLLAPPMVLMEAMRLLDGTPLHWVVGQRPPEDDRGPGRQMEQS